MEMKRKTFTTVMPDRIGAFLKADECIAELGLNITRVSYNKAVDTHVLFIEVEGTEKQLEMATDKLSAMGYLNNKDRIGDVMLVEFKLKDQPGALRPILELINGYRFNISYISSQENGGEYQNFKMGLFVENGREVSQFLKRAAEICPIKIIEYNKSERVLDNTVFYLSFANDISEKMSLPEDIKGRLTVDANLIMQNLDERNLPPYKTFDYIARFADMLQKFSGDAYRPRISRHLTAGGLDILLIEPPCGSNTCVITTPQGLVCVDAGFACYEKELKALLEQEIEGFREMKKDLLLTHADADHSGATGIFDRVHTNRICLDSFEKEWRGENALRETNPLHAPYARINKILSAYKPQDMSKISLLYTNEPQDGLLGYAGKTEICGLSFEIYQGRGGHVEGETVFVERKEGIVFSGDIFVNIKGFTKEQAKFNSLAPYLMTSVDTDPALAKAEREELFKILGEGRWLIFGGHGSVYVKE